MRDAGLAILAVTVALTVCVSVALALHHRDVARSCAAVEVRP